jgi:hypothetical protein
MTGIRSLSRCWTAFTLTFARLQWSIDFENGFKSNAGGTERNTSHDERRTEEKSCESGKIRGFYETQLMYIATTPIHIVDPDVSQYGPMIRTIV